jgi:hypothetical protein
MHLFRLVIIAGVFISFGFAQVASVLLLNRRNDCLPIEGQALRCGLDLLVTAHDTNDGVAFETDGQIIMSSTRDGSTGVFAAENVGNSTVISAPDPLIRGGGTFLTGNQAQWVPEPVSGGSGPLFLDPTRGKSDPPVSTASLPLTNHDGGTLVGSTDPDNPRIVTSGIHFPTVTDNSGTTSATGEVLRMSGNVRLVPAPGELFGEFIFPGGVEIANNSHILLGPGRYVFAGRKFLNQGAPGALLTLGSNSVITDGQPAGVPAGHPGEILIFGGPDYPGVQSAILNASGVSDYGLFNELFSMSFGMSGITAKSQPGVNIVLHGLNSNPVGLPADLASYRDVLFWQDRDNSVYQYEDDLGNYNSAGCDGLAAVATCNTGRNPAATEMRVEANTTNLFGVLYGPRGGFLTIGRGDHTIGPAIVAGTVHVARGATLNVPTSP